MLGTMQIRSWVGSGLPCWLQLLVPVGRPAVVAVPAADLGELAVALAVAAGPWLPVVAVELGSPVVAAAVGAAVDSLSPPLA